MEYRRLGHSGLQISALSYGSWVTFGRQLDADAAAEMMVAAYEAGVNFFDNAEVYEHGESEIVMGAALKKLGWRRDSYLVSSKVMWGSVPDPKPTQWGLSRKHVMEACDQALERLGLDYLDLYLCHRPDVNVPIEETVRAMSDLVSMGKVHYWGTSEWSAEQLMVVHDIASAQHLIPSTVEQPEYNLFNRQRIEAEYSSLYEKIGLGTTTYSPLGSGLLTGKYADGVPEDSRAGLADYGWLKDEFESEQGQSRIAKVGQLAATASELGVSVAQLAIAWCLKNPNVSTVILGASRLAHLEENLRSIEVLDLLTEDVMQQIEAILDNKPDPSRGRS